MHAAQVCALGKGHNVHGALGAWVNNSHVIAAMNSRLRRAGCAAYGCCEGALRHHHAVARHSVLVGEAGGFVVLHGGTWHR